MVQITTPSPLTINCDTLLFNANASHMVFYSNIEKNCDSCTHLPLFSFITNLEIWIAIPLCILGIFIAVALCIILGNFLLYILRYHEYKDRYNDIHNIYNWQNVQSKINELIQKNEQQSLGHKTIRFAIQQAINCINQMEEDLNKIKNNNGNQTVIKECMIDYHKNLNKVEDIFYNKLDEYNYCIIRYYQEFELCFNQMVNENINDIINDTIEKFNKAKTKCTTRLREIKDII